MTRGEQPGTEDDEKYVQLGAVPPPGWIALPVDPDVDAEGWAAAAVDERVHEPAEHRASRDDSVASLARAVGWVTAQTVPGLVHCAWTFQPDPWGPVLMVARATLLPWDADGAMSLTEIAGRAGSGPGTVGPSPEVTVGRLPICPAVRVRRMVQEQPGGTGASGQVVEGVTWLGLPQGLPAMLVFSAQWNAVVLGDELAGLADELAVRLELDFVQ